MTAYNLVRFKVKPGRAQEFLDVHRHLERDFPGLRGWAYCFVGEWNDMASIASARPVMIANLDRFRDTLEDLGNGLGLTDPVSGELVVDLKA